MFFLPKKINDKGEATPLFLLVLALGVVGFLLITNTFSFKDRLFGSLYLKPSSNAATIITPIDPNKLGINTSRSTLSPFSAQALVYAKDAGISWVRGNCNWFAVEPSLNKWSFDVCDKYINTESQSFNILELINTPPPACFVYPDQVVQQNRWRCDLTNYQKYVSTFVNRYKDKIKYFELSNEPDSYRQFGCNDQIITTNGQTGNCKGISMPAKYGELLKVVHDVIKKADPNANLVLGGLALSTQDSTSFNPDFLSLLVNDKTNPMLNNIEVMNFHNYGDKAALQKDMDLFKSMVGSKPIWITELGYSSEANSLSPAYPKNNILRSVYGVGEEGQVNYLNDIIPFALNTLGADKVFWYTLYDQPDDNQATFCEYGLLYIQGKQCLGANAKLPTSADFTAKKVLSAIKALINK